MPTAERLFILLTLLSMSGLATAFLSLDSVLRDQHDHGPATWLAEGRTPGFFWYPADAAHWLLATQLRARAFLRWLAQDPAWAAGRPDTLGAVRRLRMGLIVGVTAGAVSAALGLGGFF